MNFNVCARLASSCFFWVLPTPRYLYLMDVNLYLCVYLFAVGTHAVYPIELKLSYDVCIEEERIIWVFSCDNEKSVKARKWKEIIGSTSQQSCSSH